MANFDFLSVFQKSATLAVPHRQNILAYTTNLNDGATVNVLAEYTVGHYGVITGTCRSNRAVTINVYQGNSTGALNTKTSFTVAADATVGAGTGFSISVVSKYVRIEAVNPAGAATTTFNIDAWLRTI